MTRPLSDFGQELRSLRHKRGLTLDQLAAMSGISRMTIMNMELGRKATRLDVLMALAEPLQAKLTMEPLPLPEDVDDSDC